MPAREVGRLVNRLHPGVSVRQLESQAGAAEGTLARWLKPGTEYGDSLPRASVMRAIARILGCRVSEVVQAFNASLDDPLPLNDLPDDEVDLLATFRQLPPVERAQFLAIGETLRVHARQDDGGSMADTGRARRRGAGPRQVPEETNTRGMRRAAAQRPSFTSPERPQIHAV